MAFALTHHDSFPVPSVADPFVIDDDRFADLEPAPLPDGWIVSGNPRPAMRFTAMSNDGSLASGIWACGPGVFRFDYDFDEFVHLISGGMSITSSDGATRSLSPGGTAFFPRGLSTVWTVEHHVHKFFTQRNASLAVRTARRIGGQLAVLRSFF